MNLARRVARELAARELVAPGDRGLCALSGGPDSLCLLALLAELAPQLGLVLSAVTIDHGLRAESAEEAARAVALAASLGVQARAIGLGAALREGRGNLQERARRARLACLQEEAARTGARWIALGHTADDQAETVLMRIARGSGLRGFGGMDWRRGPFIRPLLGTTRIEIERELAARALAPLIDPTNTSDRFLRNRIRQQLLPLLTRENPRVVRSLCRLAANAREESEALEASARAALARARGDASALDCRTLRELPAGLLHRVLLLALGEARGSARRVARGHLEALAGLCAGARGSARLDLPGLRAERRYDRLHLIPRAGRAAAPRETLEVLLLEGSEAVLELPWGELRVTASRPSDPGCPRMQALAREKVRFPLTVRSVRPGDRIRLGPGTRRKVARVLMDAKIPRALRGRVPILTMGDEVIAVAGVCVAEAFRAPVEDGPSLFLLYRDREESCFASRR